MAEITSLFVTRLYRAALNELAKKKIDYSELETTCIAIAEDDEAGQEWCEANGYPGYTSYASLDDLPWRMPIFGDLEKALDKHVAAFCKDLGFDLGELAEQSVGGLHEFEAGVRGLDAAAGLAEQHQTCFTRQGRHLLADRRRRVAEIGCSGLNRPGRHHRAINPKSLDVHHAAHVIKQS